MPTPPPFAYKTAPDGEAAALPAATIIEQPTLSVIFPDGCTGQAILTLDKMPVMSREPEALPDIPGGGWSYAEFLEYLDMGISPVTGWSGVGATFWDVLIDGVASGTSIALRDGVDGPIGVSIPHGSNDWTIPHTWSLRATYHDRPGYHEFYINPATVGIVAFGPSTDPADPSVPYIRDGFTFGCPSRSAAFFPSALWGNAGYWDPWVSAHHGVGDTLGPVDRNGDYLGLTGPWGSAVPKQFLASVGALCDGSHQSGDAYATSLSDFVVTVTYGEHSYVVTTAGQLLAACTPTLARHAIFDPTRQFKAA